MVLNKMNDVYISNRFLVIIIIRNSKIDSLTKAYILVGQNLISMLMVKSTFKVKSISVCILILAFLNVMLIVFL